VVGGMIDASERHRYQTELAWQASHDALTGLPNRVAITQKIAAAIQRAERDSTQVCVLLIDLDHFKVINDSLGHAMGDEVLKVIALRLSTLFSGDALVGRFGGDEFVAVIPHGIDHVCATRPAALDRRAGRIDGRTPIRDAQYWHCLLPAARWRRQYLAEECRPCDVRCQATGPQHMRGVRPHTRDRRR
jgi:GGDEF domain-containing protein